MSDIIERVQTHLRQLSPHIKERDSAKLMIELLEEHKQALRAAKLPLELTAENGGKSLMIGEFSESVEMVCPECYDEPDQACEICQGRESYLHDVDVSWPTIKAIYQRVVNHYAKN